MEERLSIKLCRNHRKHGKVGGVAYAVENVYVTDAKGNPMGASVKWATEIRGWNYPLGLLVDITPSRYGPRPLRSDVVAVFGPDVF